MKITYMAGIAVLAVTIAGSIYGPRVIGSSGITWGPTQSAIVDQIIHYPVTGHVSYGIKETSGAIGTITVVQSCGLSLGDLVLYQDSNQGTRRLVSPSPTACQEIPSGEIQ